MISVNIKFKNGYDARFNSNSPEQLGNNIINFMQCFNSLTEDEVDFLYEQLVIYDLNIALSNLKLNAYIKDYTIDVI